MSVRNDRRRACVVPVAIFLLALSPATARAHWLKPEEIIAGLNQNPVLHDSVGLVQARTQANLSRLLVVTVRRSTWDQVPPEKRLSLAQDWYDTWRHNVDQGIVAIVDSKTEKSLVHFDGAGKAELVATP